MPTRLTREIIGDRRAAFDSPVAADKSIFGLGVTADGDRPNNAHAMSDETKRLSGGGDNV